MANLRTWLQEWDRQPQELPRVSDEIAAYGGFLYVPSLGTRNLLLPVDGAGVELSTVGTAPTIEPASAGISAKSTAAAAQNTFAGDAGALSGGIGGALFALVAPTAAASSGTFGGIGFQYLQFSYDHTNAAFRQVAVWRNNATTYYTASLGSFSAGVPTAIAVQRGDVALRAIRDGRVVTETAITGVTHTSSVDDKFGTNAVRSQGYTFGGRVFAVWATNKSVPTTLLQRLTADPWGELFEPRRIIVPIPSAGATTYTLSAATFVPGSITASGVTARWTVTEA